MTEDGTAASPGDYIEAVGTLTFGPGETQKMVTLEVLDDDVFEEDEHFYIRISNLRRKDGKAFSEMSVTGEDGIAKMQPSIQLGTPHMATIMILDDDHGGIFSFDDAEVEVVESVGTFELELKRISGARGKVAIPYNTEDGTAKEGEHYEAQEGELIFNNEETSKTISLEITDEESYEKNLIIYVSIGEPRQIAEGIEGEGIDYSILDAKNPEDLTEEEKVALLGRPCHGDNSRIMIRIRESKEFKSSVDKMMQKSSNAMMVGSSSWLDQFTDAFTVQADDDEEEGEEGEEGEEKMPSCGDYIMHFLTLPWKLIFAFIPPTAMANGYITFVVSIAFIGACTAIMVASSTSKMESMPLHLSPSEPACLIPSPRNQLPLKTRLQTTPLEMFPAPTPSTCSWVLESHGPWLPSTGKLSVQSSSFWPEDTQPSEESLEDPSSSRQFIFHLRLVLLRHDLCSGDVRRHRAWLLKSSHTNTRKQYMSLRTRHSPCDRCEVDPKSSSTVG